MIDMIDSQVHRIQNHGLLLLVCIGHDNGQNQLKINAYCAYKIHTAVNPHVLPLLSLFPWRSVSVQPQR